MTTKTEPKDNDYILNKKENDEPKSILEDINSKDKERWLEALNLELVSHREKIL